jgi:prepilin-type N-terminal cleavage/methylation domain-containing protein
MINVMAKNKKGFTLIELLIVIAIIGIIAAIAIPTYLGVQKKAAFSEAKSNLESLRLLEEQYFAENGCYYSTGSPAVCTDTTFNYNDTPGVADNGIEDVLPGFRPGHNENLMYTYSLQTLNGATQFRAIATGKAAAIARNSVFSINERNEKSW